MKIGFLGAGAMGGAILSGAMDAGVVKPEDVYVYDISEKIKAKYKGKTYTCKVTVKDKPAITPSTLSVDVGESHYVSVWGTAKKVTWSIADKSIA